LYLFVSDMNSDVDVLDSLNQSLFSDSSINVRPRAVPRCSRCHQTGHNKRTCVEQGESVGVYIYIYIY
jgi:hypothetical protein